MKKLIRDISSSLKESYIETVTTTKNRTIVTLVVPEWSTKVWMNLKTIKDKAHFTRTSLWRRLSDIQLPFIPSPQRK